MHSRNSHNRTTIQVKDTDCGCEREIHRLQRSRIRRTLTSKSTCAYLVLLGKDSIPVQTRDAKRVPPGPVRELHRVLLGPFPLRRKTGRRCGASTLLIAAPVGSAIVMTSLSRHRVGIRFQEPAGLSLAQRRVSTKCCRFLAGQETRRIQDSRWAPARRCQP